MELEMYLNGKLIDSIRLTASQLRNIQELQHQMEKKHCHDLQYSDGQPQFFISGMDEEDTKEKNERRQQAP